MELCIEPWYISWIEDVISGAGNGGGDFCNDVIEMTLVDLNALTNLQKRIGRLAENAKRIFDKFITSTWQYPLFWTMKRGRCLSSFRGTLFQRSFRILPSIYRQFYAAIRSMSGRSLSPVTRQPQRESRTSWKFKHQWKQPGSISHRKLHHVKHKMRPRQWSKESYVQSKAYSIRPK